MEVLKKGDVQEDWKKQVVCGEVAPFSTNEPSCGATLILSEEDLMLVYRYCTPHPDDDVQYLAAVRCPCGKTNVVPGIQEEAPHLWQRLIDNNKEWAIFLNER